MVFICPVAFFHLGWPANTKDLETYYPTSTLVTGLDILFFWVARMIMMGLKFTGKPPFRDVYIHALVRDAEGEKMSKSKGNVIDPLTKMSQYGTDALRFTLASMASPGRDIKLSENRIEGYRNFANKIWNAARFILMHADGPSESRPVADRPFVDQWILSRLNHVTKTVTARLEEYRFDQAAGQIYQHTWHEYCDWYLELIKPVLQNGDSPAARSTRATMLQSFEHLQRLLHPFMPFLTEEVWQTMPHQGESLVHQPFPVATNEWDNPEAEQTFAILEQIVTTVRTGRALLDYAPSQSLTILATAKDQEETARLSEMRHHVAYLCRGTVSIADQDTWPADRILHFAVGSFMIGMTIEGEVDLSKALARINKQSQAKQKEAARLQGRLASPDFAAKASPDVVQESKDRLALLTAELSLFASSEQQLRKMVS